ncbi:MAG TPA: hypothetical protein VMF04_00060 [Thermoplasmata archaeon]|nr:hypothetical protein [Thermoplasmata archaeon]
MAPGRATGLLLFVGSAAEPAPLDSALKPGQCEAYRADSALGPLRERPARLPRVHRRCMNAVLRIARSSGRDVTVVDVDRAAGRQHLVDRWVDARLLLPLLVRPDGHRLSGSAKFVPPLLREFILGS